MLWKKLNKEILDEVPYDIPLLVKGGKHHSDLGGPMRNTVSHVIRRKVVYDEDGDLDFLNSEYYYEWEVQGTCYYRCWVKNPEYYLIIPEKICYLSLDWGDMLKKFQTGPSGEGIEISCSSVTRRTFAGVEEIYVKLIRGGKVCGVNISSRTITSDLSLEDFQDLEKLVSEFIPCKVCGELGGYWLQFESKDE